MAHQPDSPARAPRLHDDAFKQALRVVGDFWTLRIAAALSDGDLRFCALERALGDSNPATLTNRLKKLEQLGLVARRHEQSDVAYTLTRRGAELLPVVRQAERFADHQIGMSSQ